MSRQPVFNVPATVLAVLCLFAAVHMGRWLLLEDMDNWLVVAGAFIPARYSEQGYLFPGDPIALVTSPLTHMFIHGDITHLVLNSAWLLAFGGAVALRVGGTRFLAFSLICGLAGAALFLAFNWGAAAPVVGASGAVSGLMGGMMRFLFSALDQGGIRTLRANPGTVSVMSLSEAISDRRVMAAILIWLAINALTVFGVGVPPDSPPIAWEAHVGGFIAGFLTFGAFVPDRAHSDGISQARY